MQTIQSGEGPHDVATTFFIPADQWKPTIREAIEAYLSEGLDSGPED